MCVRQPRMEWEHRHLNRKREEERPEQQHLRFQVKLIRSSQQRGNIERTAARLEIQRQNSQQHDHGTYEGVQEKLNRGIQAPVAAPHADQEIHRHKHHFPEHIEQEEIERHKNAQHAHLKQQKQNIIFLASNFDRAPGRQDRNHAQHRRQNHQAQADAVNSERVVRADRGNPLVIFKELIAWRARVQAEPPHQRQRNNQPQESK